MISSLAIRGHYVLRSLLIAALAFYIMHLNATESLHYYLAPHMQTLLLLCPVPLLFIAFGMLWHALGGDTGEVCDCEHPLPNGFVKNMTVYGLFAVPLLFGQLLPNQALGSDMASKKGMIYTYPNPDVRRKAEDQNASAASETNNHSLSADQSATQDASQQELFIAKDIYSVEFAELAKRLYTLSVISVKPDIFSETVGAIDMYKQQFQGKSITVQGFVHRDKHMLEDTFAVSRFLVMCCTADAIPFGIIVRGANASSFDNDTWVQIDGTIQVSTLNGEETLQVQAEEIQPIEQPASPYIFTNADSVAEFDELYSNIKDTGR
ncbi:TIGR03943 family putative permease subunit [Paenibacillus glucanolyticus]